jgi:hypothetical protein
MMRYKEGQELFIHLLNGYRTGRTFEIANELAMKMLGKLICILLSVFNAEDTSIPINCQVLASTFFLKMDGKKVYLLVMIQDEPIWKDVTFWERTLSQFIQFEIIKQLEEDEQLKSDRDATQMFTSVIMQKV